MASTLAERVRAVRLERGLGVNELDRLAQVGKGYTSRVEAGERERISTDLVERYAVALGVSHEWLALGTGSRQPASPDAIPKGANLPALRAVLTVLAGDTDPALVRSFWETAIAVDGGDDVPAIEWAARFVMAWMSANKPAPPRSTKVALHPQPGKKRGLDGALAELESGAKVKKLDE